MFFKVLAVALWFVSVYFTKLMLEDGFGVSSTNFISLSVAVVLQAVLSAVEIMMLNHQRFGKMDAHRQSMYSAFFVFVVFVDFLSNQRGIAAWLSQPVTEEPIVVRITKLLEFFYLSVVPDDIGKALISIAGSFVIIIAPEVLYAYAQGSRR